jgi:hypothetical protein
MKTSINNTIASLNNLVSGLEKNQPKGSFSIAGAKYTAPQLVTIMQSIVTALQAVPPAKGTYLKAVRSADTLQGQYRAVIRDLKQSLQLQASDDTEVLADYGLTPRKSGGPRSPEVKVAAAEKARATRKARNTMGPKQKLQIDAGRDARSLKQSSKESRASSGLGPGGARAFLSHVGARGRSVSSRSRGP